MGVKLLRDGRKHLAATLGNLCGGQFSPIPKGLLEKTDVMNLKKQTCHNAGQRLLKKLTSTSYNS